MSGIIPFLVWVSVIFAPDGSYTGQRLVTDDLDYCTEAVNYARSVVPKGFIVTACTPVQLGSTQPQQEQQTP